MGSTCLFYPRHITGNSVYIRREFALDFDEQIYSKDSTSIFANYAERPPTSPGNFYDAASTAFLAIGSTVYRAAQFLGQHRYLSYADKVRYRPKIKTQVQA